jgi:YHS domain-containing protein
MVRRVGSIGDVMRRFALIGAGVAAVVAGMAGLALLSGAGTAEPPARANAMCPVLRDEAARADVFTSYKGREVHFCCRKCLAKFEKDPEAFAGAVEAVFGGAGTDAAAPHAEHGSPSQSLGSSRGTPSAGELPPEVLPLLFSTSDTAAFKARRALRMAVVPPPPAVPEVTGPAFSEIDRFITARWREANLPEAEHPPEVCDDATFVRRAYLDVIGVVPTIQEQDRFLADTGADRRARLVDELLARDGDYADHWTPFWEDAIGSSAAALQGGVPTRGNYRQWINDGFKANKPFDIFAAELIDPAMPGAKKAQSAEANGLASKIAYIRNGTHVDTLQSAAAVSQVFMGTAMKCASCHNHFENQEWPQKRVLGFAGMFGPKDLEVIRCEKKSGQFVPAKFAFEIPGAPADVPQDEAGRLRRVAQLLTDPGNPRFAKAIVNRLWKRYLGLGLFEPVDDFRLDVPPSHPELLEWLAYDFMANGYDLKHTVRLILNSRTYQLRYDPRLEEHFDTAHKTDPRYFRSPTLRRLTAEQVVDSIRVAATQKLDPAQRLYLRTDSTAMTRALGKPASRNEISTLRADDAAVVQALELLNGEEWAGLVYSSPILDEAAKDKGMQGLERLYRAALGRGPREKEAALAAGFLSESAALAPAASERALVETVWIDDDTPPGASLVGGWEWVEGAAEGKGAVAAFSGRRMHKQHSEDAKPVQHYAKGGWSAPVAPTDRLFAYVYLDPADPPKALMLQWNDGVGTNDGGWAHRAYWGEDLITFMRPEVLARVRIGDLPEAGRWVRLEVKGSDIGLESSGARVVGMAFDQAGGTVYFDKAGVVGPPPDPAVLAMGDVLWAILAGPEFHYIR